MNDDRLGYLARVVEDAATYRQARVERDPDGAVVEVVTKLGERIPVNDLASAAEVLAYVHPSGTRPFDPRYLARYRPITRRDGAAELDDAIDHPSDPDDAGDPWP